MQKVNFSEKILLFLFSVSMLGLLSLFLWINNIQDEIYQQKQNTLVITRDTTSLAYVDSILLNRSIPNENAIIDRSLNIQRNTISYIQVFITLAALLFTVIGFLGIKRLSNLKDEIEAEKRKINRINADVTKKKKELEKLNVDVNKTKDEYAASLSNFNEFKQGVGDERWLTLKQIPLIYEIQNLITDAHFGETGEFIENYIDENDQKKLSEIIAKIQELENSNYTLNATHYHYKGLYFYRENELNQAVESFKKAIELSPKHFEVSDSLAGVYYFQGKFKESLNVLERLISFKSVEVNPYQYNRTIAHLLTVSLALNDYSKCKEYYNKTHNSNFLSPSYSKLEYNLKMGNIEEAKLEISQQSSTEQDKSFYMAQAQIIIHEILVQDQEIDKYDMKESKSVEEMNSWKRVLDYCTQAKDHYITRIEQRNTGIRRTKELRKKRLLAELFILFIIKTKLLQITFDSLVTNSSKNINQLLIYVPEMIDLKEHYNSRVFLDFYLPEIILKEFYDYIMYQHKISDSENNLPLLLEANRTLTY